MTKPQHLPLGIRRQELAICLVLCVELLSVAGPVLGSSRKDKFWEKADVSSVVKAVRRQQGGMPSEVECEHLVRLNLKYLYFNALTERFIRRPKPEKVLERMSRVFSLAADLKSALDEARRLSDAGGEATGVRRAARRIGDCAADIHDTFHDFFKEDTSGSLQAELAVRENESAGFGEYVVTCGRILSLLDHELDRYFLNPHPGVIDVSSFRRCSIPVLSRSLETLSLNFEKSLPE